MAACRASEAGDCSSLFRIASADAATCFPRGVVGLYDMVLAGDKNVFRLLSLAKLDFWVCRGLKSVYALLDDLTGGM